MICRNKVFLFLFFTFLVLFPAASAYGPLAALFRESIHLPLVLAVQALLIILFVKYAQLKQLHLYEPVLLGVFLLAFFLNREETPWIYPQLLWFVIGILGIAWWRYRQPESRVGGMDLLKIILVPALIVMAGIEGISNKNFEEYGIDAVVEINRPEFKSAYKGLISIKPDKPVNSAALTPDMLQKLLSLPKGSELNVAPLTSKSPLPAMFVPWHFRASTQNAGYYKKGGAAVLAFYDDLGKELHSACESGRYECRPVFLGVMPVFDGFWSKTLSAMAQNYSDIVALDGITPSLEGFPSFSDRRNSRNLSLLTSAPIALTPEDRKNLPEYYTKMEKKKTSVLEDILSFYQDVLPILTGLGMAALIVAIARSVRARKIGIPEFLLLGLFGALLTQLVIYSLLLASGLSLSSRLYFNTYPVLALFIALSLCYLGKWAGELLWGDKFNK